MTSSQSKLRPDTPSQFDVVMIYHRFGIGGIETLILRAANYFSLKGLKVLLFIRPGEMEKGLHKAVNVIHYDKYREVFKRGGLISEKTTLIAFDPLGYMVMRRLQLHSYLLTGHRSRGHGGIFHPRTLFWDSDSLIVRLLNKIVFSLASGDEFFFMSEAVRTSTQRGLKKRKPLDNRIISLPVDFVSTNVWDPRGNDVLRVVSVGRLVPFKAYNREIARIVGEFAARGVRITWDIWGEGDDFSLIQKNIVSRNLSKSVLLKGKLPYEELKRTLSSYDLFVGMGTAALEASSIGLPTICAVDGMTDKCYGFLFEAPSDCIGEQTDGANYRAIGDVISIYMDLTELERKEVGTRCREVINTKSSDGNYDGLLIAPSWPGSLFSELASVVAAAPNLWFADLRLLRSAVRYVRKLFS